MREVSDVAVWPARAGKIDLVEITLGDLLDTQAGKTPAQLAVIIKMADGAIDSRWSYAELRDQSNQLARGLIAWGVKHGDRVAVMAPNGPEWILLEYALAKIGAILVTVNPAFQRAELDYLLAQGRVSHLIFSATYRKMDHAAMVMELVPEAASGSARSMSYPELRGISMIGGSADFAMPFEHLGKLAQSISEADLQARQAQVRPFDILQIQYTSGTTGRPKGAMLSHHGTINNARLMANRAGFNENDTLLSAMPLFHTAGCVCNVMGMLVAGGCLVVLDAFEPSTMLQSWEAEAATIINAVPTMYSRLLQHPDFASYRTDSLRIAFAGGTSIPPVLMEEVGAKTGAEPMIIMGMTECSPIITQTDPTDPLEMRLSTAGTPLPHTEIKIVDPATGRACRWGEGGELCIRGYLTTKGYFDMPEKTSEAIDPEGWLHSGDLAILEASGHLRIVGRLKDMIIRGGENVFPVEIENFLLSHPEISQVQVVGVPDADLGEEIFAFVLPKPGARLLPETVQHYCRTNLARHKMPKYVRFLDAFPMTPNGKVQKFALREMGAKIIKEEATSEC